MIRFVFSYHVLVEKSHQEFNLSIQRGGYQFGTDLSASLTDPFSGLKNVF